jgi:hypothetical protein
MPLSYLKIFESGKIIFDACKHTEERVMKSYRKELWFNVPSRRGFVNITPQVEEAVRESSVQEGLVLVNASLSHLLHQAS